MVIGLLICEVLEEEMLYIIANDPELKKITFIENRSRRRSYCGLGPGGWWTVENHQRY